MDSGEGYFVLGNIETLIELKPLLVKKKITIIEMTYLFYPGNLLMSSDFSLNANKFLVSSAYKL